MTFVPLIDSLLIAVPSSWPSRVNDLRRNMHLVRSPGLKLAAAAVPGCATFPAVTLSISLSLITIAAVASPA